MMEESVNQQLDLPLEASHYNFRIGGHTHVRGKIKLGVLKHRNGNVIKPLLTDDPRSLRELSFYQQVHENYKSDPVLSDLMHFIPSFNGTLETTVDNTVIEYLCIEDICEAFPKPCVLDVKIGAITYDHLASEEKVKKEKDKYPHAEIFGFRILGMKVYNHCAQQYMSENKAFGKSLTTPEAVTAGLQKFFNNKLGQINCLVISGFLHKLLQLKSWFLKQRKLMFISSSLLFVYEGQLCSWLTWMKRIGLHLENAETCKKILENAETCKQVIENADTCKEIVENVDTSKQITENASNVCTSLHYLDCRQVFSNPSSQTEHSNLCSDCYLNKNICDEVQKCSLLRISMLDFAHAFPTSEEDSNYLFGLRSLISYLQELHKSSLEMYS